MKKGSLFVALLVCLTFLLAGCNGGESTVTPAPVPSPSATAAATASPSSTPVAHSTELTYQVTEFPISIDILYDIGSGNMQAYSQVYDQLLYGWLGDPNDLRPMIAESYTRSEDGLTYTFKIREGVKFHSGDPLTLEDVVYSFERWKACPTAAQNAAILESAEADEATHSVIVKVNTATPTVLSEICGISIFNKSVLENFDPLTEVLTTAEMVDGTGPYKFSEFKINEYVSFERVDDWYLCDEWLGGNQPQVTKLTYRLITDVNASMIAFQNGEILVTAYATDEDVAAALASEEQAIAEGEVPSVRVTFASSSHVYGIAANMTEPVIGWQNGTAEQKEQALNFRRAMAHALDKDMLNQVVYNGYAKVVDQLTSTWTEGWLEDIETYPYDVEKAKEYLAKSAYQGEELEMQYISDDEKAVAFATTVQEMLREVGITVKLQGYETGTWFSNVYTNHTFQLVAIAYAPVVAIPDRAYRSPWHSTSTWSPWCYNDPEVDALIESARVELDEKKRVAMYEEVNRLTAASCAFIPCFNIRMAILNNGNWMGAFPEPTYGVYKVCFMWWEDDGIWNAETDPLPYAQ